MSYSIIRMYKGGWEGNVKTIRKSIKYNSQTFELLCDLETHLYYESPAYVYEILKEELERNK